MKLIELLKMLNFGRTLNKLRDLAITLMLVGFLLTNMQEEVFRPMVEKGYELYTYDSYRSLEFDLMRVVKDVTVRGIPVTDDVIEKFNYYCNSYFSSSYKEGLTVDRQESIDKACTKIRTHYNAIE